MALEWNFIIWPEEVQISKIEYAVSRYQPQVVAEYLQEEVTAGRVIDPLELDRMAGVQISAIPKSHTPGKW